MADYRLSHTDMVVRTADNASIPNDLLNLDRLAYNEWLAAGNVPDTAPPLPVPPGPVPDANARITAGVLASLEIALAVKTAMQNIPDTFNSQNFIAAKIQLDALTQAFAAMLEAQADVTPNVDPKP